MIGENLRKIREDKKIGVNQLSRMSGVNASYISNLENNKRNNPSIETLQKIADALEVSVDDFFKEENEYSAGEQQKTSYESEEAYIINLLKSRGILKDGEDLSEENMQHLLNIIESAAKALKK